MEDYRPNSNRFKEEQKLKEREKKVEKVITGKVITKKKSFFSKLLDEFISDDANSVGSYILKDVIIPNAKKIISDIIVDGTDIILYGESRKAGRRSIADKVSYNKFSGSGQVRNERPALNTNYSYDNIILTSRTDAEEVLDRMYEILDTYGLVRVGDLFDLVGKTGFPTDNNYGWLSLNKAEIVRVRDGYWLKMPRAVPID